MRNEKARLGIVASKYNPSEDRIEKFLIDCNLDIILRYLKGPRILEMGCSTGIMTRRLASLYSDLTVIDGSREYIDYVNGLPGMKKVTFIQSLFEDFQTSEKFDDIILANVLEHVKDPIRILRVAKNLLSEDGRVHITVPNAYSLHRQIGKQMGLLKSETNLSPSDKLLYHRRVYSEMELKNHIKKAGLDLMRMEGIFLKPLSNAQMQDFPKSLLKALFWTGGLPQWNLSCATLYLIAKK